MELFFLFLIGLCVGSFCNVLVDRLPHGEDVLVTRSHCDFCHMELSWYELIPLVSFFLQRMRCRHCHKILSWQYPLVELLTAAGFVGISLIWGGQSIAVFIGSLIVYAMSVVLLVTDLKYFLIPDVTLVIIGIVGLAQLTLLPYALVVTHLGSALVAFLGFYILYRGTKGKGMGFGDVKLAGVLGLLLGFPSIIIALYTAFLTGAVVGVILMILGKATMKTKVPFGPFLILGWFVAAVWGMPLWAMWLNIL